jgi:hypothetical protein
MDDETTAPDPADYDLHHVGTATIPVTARARAVTETGEDAGEIAPIEIEATVELFAGVPRRKEPGDEMPDDIVGVAYPTPEG